MDQVENIETINEKITLTCKYNPCNKTFEVDRSRRVSRIKYCSPACKINEFSSKRSYNIRSNLISLTCQYINCKKSFEVKESLSSVRKYCKDDCRIADRVKIKTINVEHLKISNTDIYRCKLCKTNFDDKEQEFCSVFCENYYENYVDRFKREPLNLKLTSSKIECSNLSCKENFTAKAIYNRATEKTNLLENAPVGWHMDDIFVACPNHYNKMIEVSTTNLPEKPIIEPSISEAKYALFF